MAIDAAGALEAAAERVAVLVRRAPVRGVGIAAVLGLVLGAVHKAAARQR